jgi:uncharacterized protein (TIGR03083 family)
MSDKRDAFEMVEAEQADLVGLIRQLTPDQWSASSLCEGWSVRDVAIHIACGRKDLWTTLKLWASVGFGSPAKASAKEIEQRRDLPTADIVEWLGSPIKPRVVWEMNIQLRALMIHQQDIRRPLEAMRTIPAERLSYVLDRGLTRAGSANLGSRKRARGLCLKATDIDWTAGDGPEVVGPGEAILMAISGRRAAVQDLSGTGTAELARRL